MNKTAIDQDAVIKVLNAILEAELAGVVRYTHYAFMVFGYNRLLSLLGYVTKQRNRCIMRMKRGN